MVYAGQTVRLRCQARDDDSLPLCPTPATVTVELRDAATEDTVHVAEVGMDLVVLHRAVLTAATAGALTVATAAWPVNHWAGKVVRVTSGAGAAQERRVLSNTATVLVLDTDHVANVAPLGPLAVVPAAGDGIDIHESEYLQHLDLAAGLENTDVVAVFRAEAAAPYAYLVPEKLPFRVEGPSV